MELSVRVARSRDLVAAGYPLSAVARAAGISRQALYRTPKFVRFDATQGTSLSLIAGGFASAEPKDFRRGGVVPDGLSRERREEQGRHDAFGMRGGDPSASRMAAFRLTEAGR